MADRARVAYTNHAREQMAERRVSEAQVERTIAAPTRRHPSPAYPDRIVAERVTAMGNTLRIVYEETDMNERGTMGAAALRLRYDAEADALYVRLRNGTVAATVEIEELVYVDVDAEGRPLGIEFVVAADLLPFLRRHGGEFVLPERMEAPIASVAGA